MPIDPAGTPWAIEEPKSEFELWHKRLAEVTRRAWHLRLQQPDLRSGRMLPPPTADNGTPGDEVEVAGRLVNFGTGGAVVAKRVAVRAMPQVPTSFWLSLERPGELTLVSANPEPDATRLGFEFEASEYPEMTAAAYDVIDEQGAVIQARTRSFDFEIVAPGLGFRALRLRPSGP